ncbi:hypothetical protein [Paenibacillus tepidiphilus]|uniref:hypothetical protein n=1 Tax=Paenibacillus tepidiphilus TaxID=2608683 RepID=UPI001239F4AF|nr:hypothetical protein [Paenibacillus tepidiphilus]
MTDENMAMNKKLQRIIEKEAPALVELEQSLLSVGQSEFLIEQSIKSEINRRTRKLMNLYSADLNNAFVLLKADETGYEKKLLEAERNDILPDPYDEEQKKLLTMQIKIIENALELKRQYKKKTSGEHPIERDMVQYPLISASSPKTEKLKTLAKNNGTVVQTRHGFRQLYYENERGKFLTMHDERVLLGLFKIWMNSGQYQTFSFDFKDLAEEMFIFEPTGGEYNAILNSLQNLYATSIVMLEYTDPTSNTSSSREYHRPIHTLKLIGTPGKERAATISFHDYVQNSMIAGNYIMINMLYFNDLKYDTSRVLYPFILSELSKNQYNYVLDMDLLITQFNISTDNESRARSLIMSAMEELSTSGELISEPELKKLGNKYFVQFQVHPEFKKDVREGLIDPPAGPQQMKFLL